MKNAATTTNERIIKRNPRKKKKPEIIHTTLSDKDFFPAFYIRMRLGLKQLLPFENKIQKKRVVRT